MSDKDYKEVVIDNDAIVNTTPKELPEEPFNIPQGKKPELNPNPGYGENGETKPAIKTDFKDGGRGTPVDVVTPATEGIKVERDLVNFINGLLVKGKKIEDYIDDEGGVTQAELNAALAKRGFDGEVKVTIENPPGSHYKIKSSDYPGKSGVFRLNYNGSCIGLIVIKDSSGRYDYYAIVTSYAYKGSQFSSMDLLFDDNNRQNAFSGSIQVLTSGVNHYIKANILASSGVYVLNGSNSVGILCVTALGTATVIGMYNGNIIQATNVPPSGNFVLTDHIYRGGTKLYKHTISCSFTYSETSYTPVELILINNNSSQLSTKTDIFNKDNIITSSKLTNDDNGHAVCILGNNGTDLVVIDVNSLTNDKINITGITSFNVSSDTVTEL